MPAAFLGHGNPMNALERNKFTEAWRLFGESVPRPRAIHDFYGFPQELFDVQYSAPGSAEVAEQVADVVKPTWVGQDIDSWGLDHGTWSVLLHAFPDASIPVVQLSLNAFKSFDHHLELGRKLSALRDHGVLVIGSGNVVHNLRAVDHRRPDTGYDWAERFDDVARDRLEAAPTEVASLDGHPDFARAVPTPDHYLPLLYIAGLAGDEPLRLLVDGHASGSISMAAYTLGMECDATSFAGAGPPARLPDGFPIMDSNL